MNTLAELGELTDTEVVFLGRYHSQSTKTLAGAWTTLAAAQSSPVETIWEHGSVFPLAKGGTPVVGGIYPTRAVVEEGRLRRLVVPTGGVPPRGRVGRDDLLARLDLSDQGAYTMWKAHRSHKRLKDDSVADRELQAIARMYAATPPAERLAFELAILQRIRRLGAS
jgi:hypothetical protein